MSKNKSYTFAIPDLHATRTWIRKNLIGGTLLTIVVAAAFALGMINNEINCGSSPRNQAGDESPPSFAAQLVQDDPSIAIDPDATITVDIDGERREIRFDDPNLNEEDQALVDRFTPHQGYIIDRGNNQFEIVSEDEYNAYHSAELYWVTHYGPPTFVPADVTAWGMTLEESEAWAQQLAGEWGVTIDGICAAHRYTPWYAKNIYPPSLLKVEARGNYLVLDRKGLYDCVGVDIYEPNQDGPMYSYRGEVTEIVGWWCEEDE